MSAVSDALTALWNKVEQDDLKIILPVADSYLGAVVGAQGDPATIIAQSAALVGNLEATGITLAKTDLGDVAAAVKTLMDLEAATLITPATAAPVAGVSGA